MADRPILFSAPMIQALLAGRKTQTRRILRNVPTMPEANCHERNTPKHPAPYLDAYCGEPKTVSNPRGMGLYWNWWQVDDRMCYPQFKVLCAPGDRLWVRESIKFASLSHDACVTYCDDHSCEIGPLSGDVPESGLAVYYRMLDRAGALEGKEISVPSIHMPRWLSRLTLTVTDVRVQRLQCITETDAEAEGIEQDIWDQALACRNYMKPDGWFCMWGGPECYTDPTSYVDLDKICRASFSSLWESINGKDSWDANPWIAAYTFTVERRNIDAIPEPDMTKPEAREL